MTTLADECDTQPNPPASLARPARRQLDAAYKARILAEYDVLDRAGKGELLRREGLYTSLISEWRKQRDRGARAALATKLGRPPLDPVQRENSQLHGRVKQLEKDLWRARSVIEAQGKTSALLQEVAASNGAVIEHHDDVIQTAIIELAPLIGISAACAAFGRSRQWHYRRLREENSALQ